jgi:hypothetical protein
VVQELTTASHYISPFAFSHNKIDDLVAEAYQSINMVTPTFSSAELCDRCQHELTFSNASPAAFYISVPTESSNNGPRRVSAKQPLQTSTTNDGDGNGQQGKFFFLILLIDYLYTFTNTSGLHHWQHHTPTPGRHLDDELGLETSSS